MEFDVAACGLCIANIVSMRLQIIVQHMVTVAALSDVVSYGTLHPLLESYPRVQTAKKDVDL